MKEKTTSISGIFSRMKESNPKIKFSPQKVGVGGTESDESDHFSNDDEENSEIRL